MSLAEAFPTKRGKPCRGRGGPSFPRGPASPSTKRALVTRRRWARCLATATRPTRCSMPTNVSSEQVLAATVQNFPGPLPASTTRWAPCSASRSAARRVTLTGVQCCIDFMRTAGGSKQSKAASRSLPLASRSRTQSRYSSCNLRVGARFVPERGEPSLRPETSHLDPARQEV